MSAYEIALDSQIDLQHALSKGDVLSVLGLHRRPGWDHEMVRSVFDDAREAISGALPIYVADDVAAIWRAASEGYKPEVLHETDLMFPNGFAHIESVLRWKPMMTTALLLPDEGLITDAEPPGPCPVELVMWKADPSGVSIFGFAHQTTLAEFGFNITDGYRTPYDDGDQVVHVDFSKFHNIMLTALGHYRWGQLAEDGGDTDIGLQMQALWALMREFVPRRQPVSRAVRRRAARAFMAHRSNVTVIQLRRQRDFLSNNHEPQIVEWNHRWIVRGHWRNQWHPSLQTHRQRWIFPHIKGPEDQPLLVTDKAVEFLR